MSNESTPKPALNRDQIDAELSATACVHGFKEAQAGILAFLAGCTERAIGEFQSYLTKFIKESEECGRLVLIPPTPANWSALWNADKGFSGRANRAAKLEEALRPFALLAECFEEEWKDRPEIVAESHGHTLDENGKPQGRAITFGHLFAAKAALSSPAARDDGFYLMEVRPGRTWGDCAVWWRPNSAGYTTDLDQAGVYSEADVAIHRQHPDSVAVVPTSLARSLAYPSCSFEKMTNALASVTTPPTEGGAL